MKNRMISLLLSALMLASVLTLPASALKPGDPIGKVLYTDIVAYIDGYPIRSYNIAGNTYVVVEDLMAYGFGVTWDPTNGGRLIISTTRTAGPSDYTPTPPPPNTGIPGMPAMDYLYTTITTWIGAKQITGYNIGGYTCIFMDDLAAEFAAGYVWSPEDKALYMTSPAFGGAAPAPTDRELTEPAEATLRSLIKMLKSHDFIGEAAESLAELKRDVGEKLYDKFMSVLDRVTDSVEYAIVGTAVSGDTATVEVEITTRDLSFAATNYYVILLEKTAEAQKKGVKLTEKEMSILAFEAQLEAMSDDTLPTTTSRSKIYLTRSGDKWIVDLEKSADILLHLTAGLIG